MSDRTGIEWTRGADGTAGATWNLVTGCDRMPSGGCDHCYALTMARRLKAMGNPRYQRDGDPRTSGPGFGVTLHEDLLGLPTRWRTPRRVFANSMSDLFHPRVPDDFIARAWGVMAACPQHTFLVLTKRARRMEALLNKDEFRAAVLEEWVARTAPADAYHFRWPVPGVHLGVSAENQAAADARVPSLVRTPAAVRWISAEPLLGPIDLTRFCACGCGCGKPYESAVRDAMHASLINYDQAESLMRPTTALDWVVVGGESGPGARPMHPAWARTLRDQCQQAEVPFFFKQWGGRTPKAGGRDLDGRTWDEMPAVTR